MSSIRSLLTLLLFSCCSLLIGCGGIDDSFTMEANNPERYRQASIELVKAESAYVDRVRESWSLRFEGKEEESKAKLQEAEGIRKKLPDLRATVFKTNPADSKGNLEAAKSQLAKAEQELVEAESYLKTAIEKKDEGQFFGGGIRLTNAINKQLTAEKQIQAQNQ